MKKYLVLSLSLFLGFAGNTQVRYGLKGGLQLSQIQVKPADAQTVVNPIPTFFAGGLAEYEPTKEILLTAGLQISTSGGEIKFDQPGFSFSYRYNLLNVQIPVTVQYQYRGLSAGGGFYVSEALFGRETYEFNAQNQPSKDRREITFGNDEDAQFRRFDFGALAEAGYSFRNVKISAHYWLGLANIFSKYYTTDGDSRKNRSFGASLTYFLGEGE